MENFVDISEPQISHWEYKVP